MTRVAIASRSFGSLAVKQADERSTRICIAWFVLEQSNWPLSGSLTMSLAFLSLHCLGTNPGGNALSGLTVWTSSSFFQAVGGERSTAKCQKPR